jgi:hypothetical protein
MMNDKRIDRFEKPRQLVHLLALAALPVLPPLGLGLQLFRVQRFFWRPLWLWVWLGFYGLLALSRLQAPLELFELLLKALITLLASCFLSAPRILITKSFLLALTILGLASGIAFLFSALSWRNYFAGGSSQLGLATTFHGAGRQTTAYRLWQLRVAADSYQLSFAAKGFPEAYNWEWSHPGSIELYRQDKEGGYTEARFAPSGDPFVTRSAFTGAALAGRRFKVSIPLKSLSGSGCGKLYLSEQRGTQAGSATICPTTIWKTFQFVWTAPAAATGSRVAVNLNDFDGQILAIGKPKLEAESEGAWQVLEPLYPTGVGILPTWSGPNESYPSPEDFRFYPGTDWQLYVFQLHPPENHHIDKLKLDIQLEQDSSVYLKDLQLESSAGTALAIVPLPSRERVQLWFDHPNLLGHSLLVLALILFIYSPSLGFAGLTLFLAGLGILLTGSRSALLLLLASFLGLCCVRMRKNKPNQWAAALSLVLASSLVASLVFLPGFNRDLGMNRPEVWNYAWELFKGHALTGIGEGHFASFWQAAYPEQKLVGHSHNLWLELAVNYGIAGLLAGFWLLVSLLYIAWVSGRWQGLALVTVIFLLNIVDVSLFFASVFWPMMLVLNAFWDERKAKQIS